MRMFRIVFLPLTAVSISGFARENCGPRADLASPDEYSKYIIQVADYTGSPPRVEVSSLPSDVQSRYSATGKLRCYGAKETPYAGHHYDLTAQLTVRDKNGNANIITRAGHALWDIDGTNCRRNSNPQDCTFYVGDQVIPVATEFRSGVKCPNARPEDDWSVMRLKFPAKNITPYAVNGSLGQNLQIGNRVVTIGHSVDFHSPSPNETGPKHYGECSVLGRYGSFTTAGVSTACGCSHGCSGGSLLTPGSNPILLGIVTNGGESLDDAKAAQKRNHPNIVDWQLDGQGTYYATLSDQFLAAILDAQK